MGMPQTAEIWTAEHIRALPDDGLRHEVVDGEHLVSPAPRPLHQAAVAELMRRLDPYVREHHLGRVWTSPADIELDPRTLMQPDVFVTRSRRVKTWKDALPLRLAIEVLSPSTARADRIVKRRRFQRAAIEYWIVDLEARLWERWRPGDERPEVAAEKLEWQPEPALPPLTLDLFAFFREVHAED
jgi:Uma2 family endonuclease